jgi:alcohol dehydrogenase class IV
MKPFEFHTVSSVIFGVGEFRRVGEIAATFGRRAMILYNGSGVAERLSDLLSPAGVASIIRRQRGEPVVVDVDSAVAEARQAESDLIIGIGGGSAIDAAKAVAGLLTNGGSAVDYMEVVGKGQKITKPAAPWIAIPTTAGTGAEATRNAVVGLPEKKFKASIRSELLLPKIALIDPELGVDVPPDVTARSGMDALCQCIESYTSTGAQPITDALALKGIELAARALPAAYSNGGDIDARTDMAMAAYLSGVTLANAGLGAVHGFAAPLGANFPVPHGTICAALLPHVIAANVYAMRNARDHRGLSRYAEVGRRLAGIAAMPYEEAIEFTIQTTGGLVKLLNIPPLATFGMNEAHVPEMVALARKASSMRYNPVLLSDGELGSALSFAIQGEGPASTESGSSLSAPNPA